jgi:hypothetical protein
MNSLENEATNCERTVLALATGEVLNPAGEHMLEKHLAGCADCRREAALYRQLHGQLAVPAVPEPDEPKMQADFGRCWRATNGRRGLRRRRRWSGCGAGSRWRGRHHWRDGWLSGWSCCCSAGARGTGLPPRTGGPALAAPVVSAGETGRQNMVLTLISQSSATDRLKAVGYTSELLQADERVIKALLFTLNHDENVNVRLVAVEALSRFAADPGVREGLVRSIAQQSLRWCRSPWPTPGGPPRKTVGGAVCGELLRRQGTDVYVKEKLERQHPRTVV